MEEVIITGNKTRKIAEQLKEIVRLEVPDDKLPKRESAPTTDILLDIATRLVAYNAHYSVATHSEWDDLIRDAREAIAKAARKGGGSWLNTQWDS